MLRRCGDSSRSYPGRPVRQAVGLPAAVIVVTQQLLGQESAEVIVAQFERRTEPRIGGSAHEF